ncbi:MAG: hypothetical protein RLZZ28_394 [Bacteroidota bacterium]|jgi:hemoglobin
MKKDITTKEDINLLVHSFYDKVKADSMIGPLFTEIARVNWEKHLPVMSDFWENALFFTGTYQGNPMDLHKHLQKAMKLEQVHFQQWNQLFMATVDEHFSGENALLAKQRALKISSILQAEILGSKPLT